MRHHPKTSELYRLVGERIKNFRNAKGLTQLELGERVGASRTSITSFEAGKQFIPLHHLFSLAEALEVEIGALIPSKDELATFDLPPLAYQAIQRALIGTHGNNS